MKENQIRCPFCQQISHLIIVHGHGQCSKCGINIDECCNGEVCQLDEKSGKGDNQINNNRT